MIVFDIIGYIGLIGIAIVVLYMICLIMMVGHDMMISTDNCKGCIGYQKVCKKCSVYKHMTDEEKAIWLKED